MAKYSFELKMEIVQAYLAGAGGHGALAKQFGVKDESQVRKWVGNYRDFGEEGLMRSRQSKKYTVQFKLDVIELYQTSELSMREVATRFGIHNHPMVAQWIRKFREAGVDGLSEPKGCPVEVTKKKKDKPEKKIPLSSEIESDRIKELENQVRSLQIENAFLKELRRLRKEESRPQAKKSQGSSITSEDNSN